MKDYPPAEYPEIVAQQGKALIALTVRQTSANHIMIEGDEASLLYLSDYIKNHATTPKSCHTNVPLMINYIDTSEMQLDLHRLPCDEENDLSTR